MSDRSRSSRRSSGTAARCFAISAGACTSRSAPERRAGRTTCGGASTSTGSRPTRRGAIPRCTSPITRSGWSSGSRSPRWDCDRSHGGRGRVERRRGGDREAGSRRGRNAGRRGWIHGLREVAAGERFACDGRSTPRIGARRATEKARGRASAGTLGRRRVRPRGPCDPLPPRDGGSVCGHRRSSLKIDSPNRVRSRETRNAVQSSKIGCGWKYLPV